MSSDPFLQNADLHKPEPSETVPPAAVGGECRIIPRAEHPISRKGISDEALKVLYRLSSLGYKAYLVGGGVRDLYLGKKPKDFDVCTDARPSRLKKIFRNCRIIGRRFRIAHVFYPGDHIVEVATFRSGVVHKIPGAAGDILIDNEYGTAEEDARRRDITINGLFYDIATHSIIDYVGGVADLDHRVVRTINDPAASFIEDPVRMIRTLRHAARTDFTVEAKTLQAIYAHREEIAKANPSRLMEELFKDLRGGAAHRFFRAMMETHLFDVLVPALAAQLRQVGPDHPLWGRLQVIDAWAGAGKEKTNAVLLAVFLHTILISDATQWTPQPQGDRGAGERGTSDRAPSDRTLGDRSPQVDVWRTVMTNFSAAAQRIRISRRDAERVTQIVASLRKLWHASTRGELPVAFHRKPYLAESLDFLEVDLRSRGLSLDTVELWRKEHCPDGPPKAVPRRFGDGGFVQGGGPHRGGGERRDRRTLHGGSPAGDAESPQGAAAGPESDGAEGRGSGGGHPGGAADDGRPRRKRRRRRRSRGNRGGSGAAPN